MSKIADSEYGFDGAVMMMRLGRREEARHLLEAVVWANPLHGDAWDALARLEGEDGRFFSALLHQGHALQANPKRYDFWHNKGMILSSMHRFKEAQDAFRQAIHLNESFESQFNLGNVFCNEMRIEEALIHYERAVELDKTENAQLRVNYGEALMAMGHWRKGFQNYRWRYNAPGFPPAPRNKYPLWRGEPLAGKTILLYSEQGFGDEIQSLRFAESVRKLAGRVIMAVRPPMYRLVRDAFPDVILLYDEPPVRPDFTCAFLDVPAFIDVDPETVPLSAGFLKAPDRGFRLEMLEGINVGICWASGKRDLQPHVADTARAKSLSFQQLAPLLARPGVNLISLQQDHKDDNAMLELGVRDPMSGVTDFADTAFVMDHLDLVVTVDTSVAHLAGAMGKPVWNLVRHDAVWPWMMDGLNGSTTSCWYDSMKVYRQAKPFDWSDPLKRLAADFAEFCKGALQTSAAA